MVNICVVGVCKRQKNHIEEHVKQQRNLMADDDPHVSLKYHSVVLHAGFPSKEDQLQGEKTMFVSGILSYKSAVQCTTRKVYKTFVILFIFETVNAFLKVYATYSDIFQYFLEAMLDSNRFYLNVHVVGEGFQAAICSIR